MPIRAWGYVPYPSAQAREGGFKMEGEGFEKGEQLAHVTVEVGAERRFENSYDLKCTGSEIENICRLEKGLKYI